ncbi:hypothetical protein CPLU01_07829 [Colletotrichum plurivorum]|uniref:Uncharacterized protein n=1 Tax=Colletotrichum plurivorum TaxID=2175906 RepID=A0A8H6NE82_9PEZI|nr:hypothetical protein CPLU01_07829 [Colletotrichum plurivorum]
MEWQVVQGSGGNSSGSGSGSSSKGLAHLTQRSRQGSPTQAPTTCRRLAPSARPAQAGVPGVPGCHGRYK